MSCIKHGAERFARLDQLTPGDFRTVAIRVGFGGCIGAAELVTALEAECRYKVKGRRIGFGV